MSEFREDPVSGDWIILAPERAKRPEELLKRRARRVPSPLKECPFEDLKKSGNWPPIVLYPNEKNWKIAVIPNKYPALSHRAGCAMGTSHGIYRAKTGAGAHELLVTRDHQKSFAALSPRDAAEVFVQLQKRHRTLAKDRCCEYLSTFANWGPEAGASLYHPHYQIIALPIVPPHSVRSLHGAEQYFKKHHRCVRCDMIALEKKYQSRIIAENRHAIAIAPYASKRPFEVSILPKVHASYFEKTSRAVTADMALLVRSITQRMKKRLHDPDLNFFIHDAPVDGRAHNYHHWHVEVVPANVISGLGGFEISTIVNINVVDPDMAAKILRGRK